MAGFVPFFDPKSVWMVSPRTLTQTQYPFWSAIITQQAGKVAVASATYVNIDIQPPAGETWYIELGSFLATTASGSYVMYNDYDGITLRHHARCLILGGYGLGEPTHVISRILVNALWGRFNVYNSDAVARDFFYSYSGFKLSHPLWQPRRFKEYRIPFKRPLNGRAVAFPQLKDYVYLDPEDRICYHLLSKVLAVNKDNFPIERLEIHVAEEDLVANLVKIKADPVGTGWKEIFDKLAGEGIYL